MDEGKPRAVSGPGEGAAPRTGPTGADGDFLLGPPEDRASGAKTDGPAAADDFELPAPDRPEPPQDYDSSSTPPYGVPGPWAPAPRVQHPATTTATHGTGIPTPTGSEGQGTAMSAPPTPAPRQGQGTPTPSPHPDAAVPPGDAPVPAPGPHLDGPAHPPAAQPSHPVTAPPAPLGALAPPPPGRPPASAASVAPAAPSPSDTRPPQGQPSDSAQDSASSMDAPTPFPATATAPPAGRPPVSPPAPATPNPWQNYDPWAPVPAPLQQTGAVVDTVGARRRRARRALLTGALLLALVAGGIGGVVGAYLERNGMGGDVVELPQAEEEPAGRAPGTVAGIAARSLPSVVTLHVSGAEESGTGTGFVLDGRGHILTNNHVVEPAGADGEISVTFQSGDTAVATVVGRDSGYDLAVVQVRGVGGLRPMPLGNSDSVQVGDPVVAIGAPFDLEGTVTSGIISAKERPITAGGESGEGSDVSYVDALQTDAPINPGNSGGPLLDSRARVIGINSAIRSADDGTGSGTGQAGSIGLGFAIPVNQAKRVAEELINTGRATHPVIGVTLDMDYTGDGARIGTKGSDGGPAVTEGGPGDRAGLRAGDVISEVDGRRIHSGDELIVRTRAHRPGDRLRLTVKRDGRERSLSLVLGSSDGG
ncbi:trypsin-like peptidase domain-containing protein [Streptomyces sp. CC0208]|uniref:S1C family serine protease n=1 Tax=Streptomyces sp. CC0208 TaxID=2306165 RepID=UPI0013C40A47|nr:trypsin-like peptidase domain-containing protein [Streptomyces sp. CC0208]